MTAKASRYPKEWAGLPSVTEVLECIPKPKLIEWYKRMNYAEIKKSSEESKSIGTATNDLIDAFEKGEGPEVSVEMDSSLAPRVVFAVKRYMEWRKTKELVFIASQVQVFNSKMGYVGTIDRLERGPQGLYIIDWKVSKKLYLAYQIQVIAYKYAYEAMHGEKIAGCYLIRLGKEDISFDPQKDVMLVEDKGNRKINMFAHLLNFLTVFKKENENDGND